MKLLRYGLKGQEKPGLLDKDNHIRDLSHIIEDINPKTLSKETLLHLSKLDPNTLPIVASNPRMGACVNNRISSNLTDGKCLPRRLPYQGPLNRTPPVRLPTNASNPRPHQQSSYGLHIHAKK